MTADDIIEARRLIDAAYADAELGYRFSPGSYTHAALCSIGLLAEHLKRTLVTNERDAPWNS
jgi:hypothetical protein